MFQTVSVFYAKTELHPYTKTSLIKRKFLIGEGMVMFWDIVGTDPLSLLSNLIRESSLHVTRMCFRFN